MRPRRDLREDWLNNAKETGGIPIFPWFLLCQLFCAAVVIASPHSKTIKRNNRPSEGAASPNEAEMKAPLLPLPRRSFTFMFSCDCSVLHYCVDR